MCWLPFLVRKPLTDRFQPTQRARLSPHRHVPAHLLCRLRTVTSRFLPPASAPSDRGSASATLPHCHRSAAPPRQAEHRLCSATRPASRRHALSRPRSAPARRPRCNACCNGSPRVTCRLRILPEFRHQRATPRGRIRTFDFAAAQPTCASAWTISTSRSDDEDGPPAEDPPQQARHPLASRVFSSR